MVDVLLQLNNTGMMPSTDTKIDLSLIYFSLTGLQLVGRLPKALQLNPWQVVKKLLRDILQNRVVTWRILSVLMLTVRRKKIRLF